MIHKDVHGASCQKAQISNRGRGSSFLDLMCRAVSGYSARERELTTHHECLKVRPPPLCEAVSDFPVGLSSDTKLVVGCEDLVESRPHARDLFLSRFEVVAGELEEGVGDLEHEDVSGV